MHAFTSKSIKSKQLSEFTMWKCLLRCRRVDKSIASLHRKDSNSIKSFVYTFRFEDWLFYSIHTQMWSGYLALHRLPRPMCSRVQCLGIGFYCNEYKSIILSTSSTIWYACRVHKPSLQSKTIPCALIWLQHLEQTETNSCKWYVWAWLWFLGNILGNEVIPDTFVRLVFSCSYSTSHKVVCQHAVCTCALQIA